MVCKTTIQRDIPSQVPIKSDVNLEHPNGCGANPSYFVEVKETFEIYTNPSIKFIY